MDENRINAASQSLKHSQQLLGRLLADEPEGPARNKISQVMTHLVQAQDAIIVLREAMQGLEFDNAALRQRLRAEAGSAATGPAATPPVKQSPSASEIRSR